MIDIMGWAGSALLVFSLLQRQMLWLRVFNLAACLVLVAYNLLISVWPMVGMNGAVALIDIYYLVKIAADRRSARLSRGEITDVPV